MGVRVVSNAMALPGFDAPPEREPLSRARALTAKHRASIERGVHPATARPLRGDAETCGSCAFLSTRRYANTYHKCARAKMTASPNTDIRLSWPACDLWESPEAFDVRLTEYVARVSVALDMLRCKHRPASLSVDCANTLAGPRRGIEGWCYGHRYQHGGKAPCVCGEHS